MAEALPVVFLHAFPLDASMWDGQLGALGGRAHHAIQFPGFGGEPLGSADLGDWADGVAKHLDSAGVDKAVVVGLSMGGYAAFRLWDRHRERIAALVLADTSPAPDDEEKKAGRTSAAQRVRAEGIDFLVDSLLGVAIGDTSRANASMVDEVRAHLSRGEPEAVARALEAMRDRPDSTGLLATIDVPTLVIVGAEDAVTPPEVAESMVGAIEPAEGVVLDGAGHLSNLEAAGAFNDALERFLGVL